MASSKQRPRAGEEHSITIDRLAYGGKGVGRLEHDGRHGMAVFVPRVAPGDRVRVQLDRVKRRHAEGSVVAVEQPGPDRVDPPCPHYAEGCGGCSWQHLDYATQLRFKEALVRESFERIGGFEGVEIEPIVAADEPWYYRNKMEFSFHARDGLGLHVAGDWRHIVPVSECRLESELAMRVVEFGRGFAARHEISSWDPLASEGFLRELVVRHGHGSGQTMVALVTSPGSFPRGPEFAAGVAALDPSIASVLHAVRDISDGAHILDVHTLHGSDTIVERVGGLDFNIALQTFFQTSTSQAGRMLEMVRRAVDDGDRTGLLFDIFCGVGFFTLGLADLFDEVVGVEIVEPSIVAARINARTNDIDNAVFYAGDARRTLPDVIERHGTPQTVVIDPPRSGAGAKVMRRLARTEADRIVYVSCNPTTLARDLAELTPFGYRLRRVEPIDLFPQTYHVETIVTVDRVGTSA